MDGAVDFFGQRNIKWWKSARSGDDTSVDGPTRNMASSQVACVNFLLPLVGIPGALSAALQAMDGDVRAVVNVNHEGRTSAAEFEWLGIPRSLEGGSTRGASEHQHRCLPGGRNHNRPQAGLLAGVEAR